MLPASFANSRRASGVPMRSNTVMAQRPQRLGRWEFRLRNDGFESLAFFEGWLGFQCPPQQGVRLVTHLAECAGNRFSPLERSAIQFVHEFLNAFRVHGHGVKVIVQERHGLRRCSGQGGDGTMRRAGVPSEIGPQFFDILATEVSRWLANRPGRGSQIPDEDVALAHARSDPSTRQSG